MINTALQNKNLHEIEFSETTLNQHELLIINKLKHLSLSGFLTELKKNKELETLLPLKKNACSYRKSLKQIKYQNSYVEFLKKSINSRSFLQSKKDTRLNYFFYKNPINLLFSIDQFLFELAKKKPQGRKSSEFQQQLKSRKKLTLFYGHLSKKQLKRLIAQSKSYQGYFSKNFFSILERRLDIVLYRSGLVKNIVSAKQLISHKKILVNNKVINSTSYQVNPGDIISITPNKNNKIVSPLSDTILAKFKKRHSFLRSKKETRFTMSSNFVYKLENVGNFKNYKQKNLLKNFIRLLLTKIDKRACLKIKDISGSFLSSGFIHEELSKKYNLTLLKLKPLLSKQAKSFLWICIQKNYLTLNKKPLFFNKATRCFNILSRCRHGKKIKIQQKTKNSLFSEKTANLSFSKKNNKVEISKQFQKQSSLLNPKQSSFLHKKERSLSSLTNKEFSSFFFTSSFFNEVKKPKTTQGKLISTQEQQNFNIFTLKRIRRLYRSYRYKTLLLLYSCFYYSRLCFSSNKKQTTSVTIKNQKLKKPSRLLTLKLKKYITKTRSRKQIKKALRICPLKPMHIEVSYSMCTAIFLYSPQRLSFPFYIDVDLILRSFR